VIGCQHDVGIKPEFGALVFSVYVHMSQLTAIIRVKVEAISNLYQRRFSFADDLAAKFTVWPMAETSNRWRVPTAAIKNSPEATPILGSNAKRSVSTIILAVLLTRAMKP
jgi:hypothetical protein